MLKCNDTQQRRKIYADSQKLAYERANVEPSNWQRCFPKPQARKPVATTESGAKDSELDWEPRNSVTRRQSVPSSQEEEEPAIPPTLGRTPTQVITDETSSVFFGFLGDADLPVPSSPIFTPPQFPDMGGSPQLSLKSRPLSRLKRP